MKKKIHSFQWFQSRCNRSGLRYLRETRLGLTTLVCLSDLQAEKRFILLKIIVLNIVVYYNFFFTFRSAEMNIRIHVSSIDPFLGVFAAFNITYNILCSLIM